MRHPYTHRDVPLVLRNVPARRLGPARRLTDEPGRPGDVWWELVDAACPVDRPPAAVALTRPGALGVVHVVAVGVADPADVELHPGPVRPRPLPVGRRHAIPGMAR